MRSGDRLASERELLGLSQDSLALAAGVPVTVVDRVERNLGQPDEIEKVSSVLHLDRHARFDCTDDEEDYLDDPFDEPDAAVACLDLVGAETSAREVRPIDGTLPVYGMELSTASRSLAFGGALVSVPVFASSIFGEDPSEPVKLAIIGIFVLGIATMARGIWTVGRSIERSL